MFLSLSFSPFPHLFAGEDIRAQPRRTFSFPLRTNLVLATLLILLLLVILNVLNNNSATLVLIALPLLHVPRLSIASSLLNSRPVFGVTPMERVRVCHHHRRLCVLVVVDAVAGCAYLHTLQPGLFVFTCMRPLFFCLSVRALFRSFLSSFLALFVILIAIFASSSWWMLSLAVLASLLSSRVYLLFFLGVCVILLLSISSIPCRPVLCSSFPFSFRFSFCRCIEITSTLCP